jgi:hypothetical protein
MAIARNRDVAALLWCAMYVFCVSRRRMLRLLALYRFGISAAATQRNTFEELL